MDISTVVSQKYFNGVVQDKESKKYKELVIKHFNEVGMVAFGQIKFLTQKLPKKESDYNFTVINNLVRFAKENNLSLQYNTIINNKTSFPEWYWKLTASEKIQFLEFHIKTIVKKYKNDLRVFKLVNEMTRDETSNFLGTGEIKSKLISEMFKWAKEESSDSLFMINDFGCFFNKEIRAKYVELISNIKNQGGPIDIVGEQGHMWPFVIPNDQTILETLTELKNKTDFSLYITEFDLSYDDTLNGGKKINPNTKFTDIKGNQHSDWFEYQGFAYKHFYELCNKSKLVKHLTFWGFVDENAPWERPGIGLYDSKLNPKPAAAVLA